MRILPIAIAGIILSSGFLYLQKILPETPTSRVSADVVTTSATNATSVAAKDNLKGSLVLGGDVMLARWVESRALKNGWDNLFANIKDNLSKPNCAIVNLESPVKGKKPQTKINSMIFAAKPESVEALTSAGIDAVSLANNHITDQGSEGLSETISVLSDNDIAFAGAGDTDEKAQAATKIKCGNISVELIAASYGTNFPAEGVSVARLDSISSKIKDDPNTFTIVFLHWGSEYNASPSPYQRELAHSYIDAGADLVVGSHPHVLQPIEVYKNKTIAYSLGNLVFDQASGGKKTEGALLTVDIIGDTSNFSITPIKIKNYFEPTIAEDTDSYKESLELDSLTWQLTD